MSTDQTKQPDATPPEGGLPETDLDIQLEILDVFNVQYTLIRDEAGSTIECAGGDRGMKGFRGLAITYNFGPATDDLETSERFLFIGLARL